MLLAAEQEGVMVDPFCVFDRFCSRSYGPDMNDKQLIWFAMLV